MKTYGPLGHIGVIEKTRSKYADGYTFRELRNALIEKRKKS
jgi:hypothetical protein